MTESPDRYAHAPLAGIRVLDLTRLLPGPMATLILADLGAQVDKLEDPGAGDYLRHMPGQWHGVNTAFRALNRDKRSGVLDLKKPAAAAALLTMMGHYDVVVESFRPGVLAKLGLSHERMREVNPRLIVCAITGYGQTGPLSMRAGHDLNYLARAGVLGVTGPTGAPPALSGAQIADVAGGAQWAVTGILGALIARARTGVGRVVDVSMCEGSVPLATFALAASLADEGSHTPRGAGPLTGGLAPYQTYRTQDDRFVALGALEPKFWQSFCAATGIEPSMEALMPGPHQATWHERLTTLFGTRTRDEWAALGAAHDCCVEPVLEPSELPSDPQHQHRRVFFDLDGLTHFRTPAGHPEAVHQAVHERGADTDAILGDAGLPGETIGQLRASGALGPT